MKSVKLLRVDLNQHDAAKLKQETCTALHPLVSDQPVTHRVTLLRMRMELTRQLLAVIRALLEAAPPRGDLVKNIYTRCKHAGLGTLLELLADILAERPVYELGRNASRPIPAVKHGLLQHALKDWDDTLENISSVAILKDVAFSAYTILQGLRHIVSHSEQPRAGDGDSQDLMDALQGLFNVDHSSRCDAEMGDKVETLGKRHTCVCFSHIGWLLKERAQSVEASCALNPVHWVDY
jgi:hypothetical protein